MDLIALLPAPLITLAIAILKRFSLPSTAAPWVALALAVVSTVVIRVLGITPDNLVSIVVFLAAWVGSMGTHEAAKNLVGGTKPATP